MHITNTSLSSQYFFLKNRAVEQFLAQTMGRSPHLYYAYQKAFKTNAKFLLHQTAAKGKVFHLSYQQYQDELHGQ